VNKKEDEGRCVGFTRKGHSDQGRVEAKNECLIEERRTREAETWVRRKTAKKFHELKKKKEEKKEKINLQPFSGGEGSRTPCLIPIWWEGGVKTEKGGSSTAGDTGGGTLPESKQDRRPNVMGFQHLKGGNHNQNQSCENHKKRGKPVKGSKKKKRSEKVRGEQSGNKGKQREGPNRVQRPR